MKKPTPVPIRLAAKIQTAHPDYDPFDPAWFENPPPGLRSCCWIWTGSYTKRTASVRRRFNKHGGHFYHERVIPRPILKVAGVPRLVHRLCHVPPLPDNHIMVRDRDQCVDDRCVNPHHFKIREEYRHKYAHAPTPELSDEDLDILELLCVLSSSGFTSTDLGEVQQRLAQIPVHVSRENLKRILEHLK